MKTPLRVCGWLIALLTAITADAVPVSMPGTVVHELPRSSNGRTYLLSVALPSNYDTNPTAQYPVLYFPDGYWDFPLMACTSGNLCVDGALPELLVVGIGYAGDSPNYSDLRALDLTPGVDSWYDWTGTRCGKADDFIRVLENEIIPFIESHYRVNPSFRVLAGNSFGGLFTTYVAFQRPDLFQGYIASSPSLWWRSNFLLDRETVYARNHTSFPVRLFFAYASGDSYSIISPTQALYRQLCDHSYTDLAVAMRGNDGERHSSTKAEAFTRGLRFAFAPIAPSPSVAGTSMPSALINISTRGFVGTGHDALIAGFTIDGFEPKRVLVRALGPALRPFGVPNVVSDPRLAVHKIAGDLVAENDNWEETLELLTAINQVGTFPCASGSTDAAVVLTLPPGVYTAVVTGTNGATGNAEVEVYELP